MNMTFNEFYILSFTRWNEKYLTLTIDMTKDKCTGRSPLGQNFLFFFKKLSFSNQTSECLFSCN